MRSAPKPEEPACVVCCHVPTRDAYRVTSDGHAWIHTYTGLAFACSGDGERSPVGSRAWAAARAALAATVPHA